MASANENGQERARIPLGLTDIASRALFLRPRPWLPNRSAAFPFPDLADLPEDVRSRILEVQAKAGFVPNVFLALAHRPERVPRLLRLPRRLLLASRGLPRASKEMIVVATSGANDCLYCVVAHGAILRIYEKDPLVADQVAVNYRKADITPRQRAMLDFAMKVALDSRRHRRCRLRCTARAWLLRR